jgi:hypothetical protein
MMFNYNDSFASANALEGYERLVLLATRRSRPGNGRSSSVGRQPATPTMLRAASANSACLAAA